MYELRALSEKEALKKYSKKKKRKKKLQMDLQAFLVSMTTFRI